MPGNTVEQIGRVIVRASEIENALRKNGATGTGLRELSDSLEGKIAPELKELLRYIGTVRNQAAHEGADADLERWSPEFFEEACDAVLAELGATPRISPAEPTPAREIEPKPEPKPEPPISSPSLLSELEDEPPLPPRSRMRRLAKAMAEAEGEESEEYDESLPSAEPPIKLEQLAFIPGLHVIYPLKLLWESLSDVPWQLLGICCYIGSAGMLFLTWELRELWLLAPAGALFLAGYLTAVSDRIGADPETPTELPRALYWTPYFNIIHLIRGFFHNLGYVKFFGAATLLAIPFIGLSLAFSHNELLAAAIVLTAGYLAGCVIAFQSNR